MSISSARRATAKAGCVAVTCMAMTLGIAGCGDDDSTGASDDVSTSPSASSASPSLSPSPSQSSTAPAALGDLPTVDGKFGTTPTVSVPDTEPPTELVAKILSEGDGPTVKSGQILVVDYLGVRWENGETFDSSFGQSPAGFSIGTGAVIDGWDMGLVGVPVGSRVLLVVPPELGYGDSPPGEPIQAGDTLVFVVDVLGVHDVAEAASGEPAPTEDDSLPYVSITPKEPEIVIPAGDPVNRLIAIPVVVGDGPKVQSGDAIVLQYKGVVWRTEKEFDSSWSRQQPITVTIPNQALIAGWNKGLVGQTVGSRVMLVVPPKDGYGSAGQGPIKGTDTIVFAVDILGAY